MNVATRKLAALTTKGIHPSATQYVHKDRTSVHVCESPPGVFHLDITSPFYPNQAHINGCIEWKCPKVLHKVGVCILRLTILGRVLNHQEILLVFILDLPSFTMVFRFIFPRVLFRYFPSYNFMKYYDAFHTLSKGH